MARNRSQFGTPRSRRPLRLETLEERSVLTAGDLDPSFGVHGVLYIQANTNPAYKISPFSEIKSGNIYVADRYTGGPTVRKYDLTGAADATFGTNGKAATSYSVTGGETVAIQSNGSGVTIDSVTNGTNYDASVARFTSTGAADSTFGTSGSTVVDFTSDLTFSSSNRVGRDNARQIRYSDTTGKTWVLAGGDLEVGSNYYIQEYMGIARLNSDGTLDTTFSGNGKFTFEFNPATRINFVPSDLLLMSDGGAIAFGTQYNSSTSVASVVAIRVTSTGALDTNFGSAGKLTLTTLGSVKDSSVVKAVFDSSSNKIIVGYYGATAGAGEYELRLTRLNSTTGAIDTTFGTNGIVGTGHLESPPFLAPIDPFGLAVQSDGKAVVAMGNPEWKLRRYTTTGAADTSFGVGGLVTTAFSTSSFDYYAPSDIDLQADGKIVVTGTYTPLGVAPAMAVVARYQIDNSGTTDATSSVQPLPASSLSNAVTISWSGTATGGVASYDVAYRIGNEPPVIWLKATTATSAVFNVPEARGKTVGFYSVARDNAGRTELAPLTVDTQFSYIGAPWQNPANRFDVVPNTSNPNAPVDISDILAVVYEFNQRQISDPNTFAVTLPPTRSYASGPYPDVNGDNFINITDILAIVFKFNDQQANPEGESSATILTSAVTAAVDAPVNQIADELVYLMGYDLQFKKKQ